MLNVLLLTLALLQPGNDPVPSLPLCPAATSLSDEITFGLATSADYASTRSAFNLQATTAANVRLLQDPYDGAACQRMLSYASKVAQAHGGTLAGSTPVFYKAGGYYLAVVTIPPAGAATTPGAVHIRDRMVPVYVFDANLNIVASLAL